jgi:ribosomal-protein-alanine N-acetyltransferase
MINPPSLTTPRLRLVPHAPWHLRALIESAEAYAQSFGIPPAEGLRGFMVSEHVSPDWLARLDKATEADPWTHGFALIHSESETVIGTVSFTGPPDAEGVAEIAYGIVPAYEGHGFATEAAAALVAWARETGLVRKIRAHTLPERNASTHVLEKCAFRHIGELTDPTDGLIWRWEKNLESV